MKRPLLVIDGDSLAHRAYHALPKTIRRAAGRPSNAIVGFTNFLLRLWDSEQPRAVFAGWDTLEVPTYRRDSFQPASDRTTIVQPVRGVSELARVGPAEVRERYGVEPAQVIDFIALRGDPSDRLPGAPGVGPKKAADLLRQYGSLEEAIAAGRFAAIAEDLRLYRRIAALDASAPLPSLEDQTPKWAEASSLLGRWGMNAVAERVAARSAK